MLEKWLPGGYFLLLLENNEWKIIPFILIWAVFGILVTLFIFITVFVPSPRLPLRSEKKFRTVDDAGNVTDPEPLPSWHDTLALQLAKAQQEQREKQFDLAKQIETPEVFITLVVPAFNEEHRLTGMLEEAVNHLEKTYSSTKPPMPILNGSARSRTTTQHVANMTPSGWEILLINDGSTDATLSTCTTFMKNHILPPNSSPRSPIRRASGPWTHHSDTDGVRIPPGSIRMITLEKNRGKGGAVTHGLRHARGAYVLFADADGASKFSDLDKLLSSCITTEDSKGRAIALGSRAHLVGTTAVVQRSPLRNFLMHSFHLLLRIMTPPATARIKDTQCGFKLFSRPALPYIVPHMHTEGWIFDVEMLMLAEFAGIPVVEVAVGWREVVGSKLNVVWDSIGMAWGLAVLRVCWGVGIYRR